MNPIFLTISEVLEIHKDQIEKYGGDFGIRDMGLLQSAIAIPAAGTYDQYFHNDIFEMAAAYLFHIVQNHPFIDGNKRTGAVAALVFLILNDINLDLNEYEFEEMVMKVAQGRIDKAEITSYFRKNFKE